MAVVCSPVAAQESAAGQEIEHLQNIEIAEARRVLTAVRREQATLRRGEATYFHLYSGAPASYDQNKVAPIDAFVELDLGRIWQIKRISDKREVFPVYELTVTPNGLGQTMWKLTVQMGWADPEGRVERITMFFGPPPPF
ncbi:hypothetical protein K3146_00185 [Qipengyuania sp. 1NDH10]|nr:hypothetical protein [Qipengyuania vesicularis]